MRNLYHHELLDRLHCMCVMFEEMIIDHDSDGLLSDAEKNEAGLMLSNLYQKAGSRIED